MHPTDPADDSSVEDEALYARFPRRLQAMSADAFLGLVVFYLAVAAASATGSSALVRVVWILLIVLFLAYEPLMVSRFGATLGHRFANLDVVRESDGGRLSGGTALLRWLLKSVVGIPSFVAMLVTARHQALHDRWRRALVIGGYAALVYVATSIVAGLMASEMCLLSGICSPGEETVLAAAGLVWLVATCLLALVEWRGLLPGARARRIPVVQAEESPPSVETV